MFWNRKKNEIRTQELFEQGNKYFNGEGVEQDIQKGLQLLKEAADLDSFDAQYYLGQFYYNHDLSPNYEQALYYLKKVAKRGLSEAAYIVGICYDEGKGVSKGYKKAIKWYGKAADKGHYEAMSKLFLCVASAQINYKKSNLVRKWICKAADEGVDIAQFLLGYRYLTNWEMFKDEKRLRFGLIKRQNKAMLMPKKL